MKANRLTISRLAAALKMGRKTWLSDDESLRNRGRLVARISNSTAALFYFRYSVGGRYRSIPLGPHSVQARAGYLTLEQARQEAARLSTLYRESDTGDVREALKQGSRSPSLATHEEPPPSEAPTASTSLFCTDRALRNATQGRRQTVVEGGSGRHSAWFDAKRRIATACEFRHLG